MRYKIKPIKDLNLTYAGQGPVEFSIFIKKGKEMSKEIDHVLTQNIVCPYCGYEHQDSWEWPDGDDNTACENCDKIFIFERIISCEYTTKKKDGDDTR